MKTTLSVLFLLFCFTNSQAQSYEMERVADTINKIDSRKQKQGQWIMKGRHKPGSGFRPEQTIETGLYLNNRKEGEWIEYYSNGKMRNKLTYVNGTLDGPAVFYDQTEKVLKEGAFKANKWVQ